MPIYRLNSSGTWQKLLKLYRLASSGTWQPLANLYRLSSGGNWQKIFSSAPDTVTQTAAPTFPGGSGEAFTSVTKGSAGSYTFYNTGFGIVTTLVKVPIGTTPVSNTETKYGTDLANTYTVTQSDATTPVVRYYTQDAVKNVAGTKTYYFYSSGYVQAYVGNITDNYNRTVASGLGTSSSSYIYSSYANSTASWSVNGTRAVNSGAVSSGAAASSHPLQTIEVGSSLAAKANKTYSIDIPDGKGGQGVAFWTTSANSWYAVTSSFDYNTSTITQVTCSGTGSFSSTTSGTSTTQCNTNNPTGSSVGQRCIGTSCTYVSTTTPCIGNIVTTSTCPGCGSLAGDQCTNCTCVGNSSTSYSCSGGTIARQTQQTLVSCSAATVGQPCAFIGTTGIGENIRYNYTTCAAVTTTTYTYQIRATQYNFTYQTNQNQNVTQYTYNTRMKIWSAVSGTVVSEAWDNVGNSSGFITSATNTVTLDPSLYVGIYKITATSNNNTVTAIAYNAGGSQMGSTLTKTFASPTKSNANNETSAGIIKAYSPFNVGTLYDNLSIT